MSHPAATQPILQAPAEAPGSSRRVHAPPSSGPLPLEAVLVTERLAQRPSRARDDEAENRALHSVARSIGASPQRALEALMHEAVALCRPDGNATAGVSLLERDPNSGAEMFRWTALAGRLSRHVGGTTPRGFSPCGDCLDRMRPVLFDRPDLRYTYFLETGVPFVEGLVLPFYVGGEAAGTIWLVSHDDSRSFDAEDVRIMTSLADFTGAVYAVIRARDAAETASRDRQRLLQTVAHEWRTPLGTISGMTALIADGIVGPVTEQQRELLDRTRAAAQHLLALVNEVLEEARLVPQEARVEQLDLYALVADAAAMIEPTARAAGLDFDVETGAGGDVKAMADATRVRQIVLNLLGNAVKYTERGSVRVAVGVTKENVARIVVRDTGIGIPAENVSRIFDRFWRGDHHAPSADGRPREGAGLGLAISRDLARAMGGDLTVESVRGEGSTFTFSLPTSMA